jgi:hypothetical protein
VVTSLSNRSDRHPPVILALVWLSTCVSVSPTSTVPPNQPPSGPFADFTDPVGTSSVVATVEGVLAAPALQSLYTFAGKLSIYGTHAPVPSAPARAAACTGGAPAPGAAGAPFAGRLAVIPDSALTRVFAYDSATQTYRPNGDSSGPAGGVRFLLPQIAATGVPAYPLTTVGWFDVTAGSAAAGADSLHGRLVAPGMTLVDYVMMPVGTPENFSEHLAGSFAGGGYTFEFRDSTGRVGTQVSAAAVVDDTLHGVHMTLTATRTATDLYDNFYALDFTLSSGGQRVRLKGTIDTFCVIPSTGLTVFVDDTTFATVTNGTTPSNPTITRGDGKPATAAQTTAVLDLIHVQTDLFRWLESFSLPGSLMLGP